MTTRLLSIQLVIIPCCLLLTLICYCVYIGLGLDSNVKYDYFNNGKIQYSTWPSFTLQHDYSQEAYASCFTSDVQYDGEDMLVKQYEALQQTKDPVCVHLLQLLQSVYEIESRYSTPLTMPPPFASKVSGWLNGDQQMVHQLDKQHLIHVRNHLTGEQVIYNPVRSHRPHPPSSARQGWQDKLAKDTEQHCDFCNVYNSTATDIFGRHTTATSVRVSSVFKMEHYHGMVVTHQHHPTNISREVYTNFLADAVTLAGEMLQASAGLGFPHLTWDTLPKAGAVFVHPHIHVLVAPDAYHGYTELNRQGAEHHYRLTGRNLFTTMVEVHHALGLTVNYGNAVALALLSGKGDLEVMVMSAKPGPDFYALMYLTTKAYHDSFDQYCYTKAVSWNAGNPNGAMPAIARIFGREDCNNPTSDVSFFNVFLGMYRGNDPWVVVSALRQAVTKYGDS